MQSRSQLATAEAFIDGFYSFEQESLGKLIATGPDAESILYYQAWAQAAHYQVLERQPCKDLFAGGKTPGDCARAVAAGVRAYRSEHSH